MNKTRSIQPYVYGVTLFFITLSGFAQMPIFKRYYIADIPGLGWLANFYATHLMHYIFAGIFISLVVYSTLDFIFFRIKFNTISLSTMIKSFLFAGLILTGILLVIKNFSGTPFSPGFIMGLDILHLVFCMALMFFGLYQLIKRKKTLSFA